MKRSQLPWRQREMKHFAGAMFVLLWVFIWAMGNARAQDSALIFNEIQYHPANEVTQTEWIELRSLQGVNVDIGGWRLSGGIDYTFPNGTVMPGRGYLVVAAIPAQIAGALGPFTGQLANGGETLRLLNRNGRIMDELSYGDSDPWPLGPDGGGVTLARRAASAATGASAWTSSAQVGGTPGVKNFADAGDLPTVTTLVSLNASWRYRDDNVAQPAGWAGLTFDDSDWVFGTALLYAGSPNVTGAGDGLFGYWPLQETTGTTTANLATGGTAGTLFSGASWVSDATRGQVLAVDGVDGYVSAGTLPQMTMTNDFTWSFWANSAQTGGNVIVGNRFSPTGAEWSPREFIKFTSDMFQFDHNSIETIDYTDFPVGSWVHHAIVKQGSLMTYYRNGAVGGTRTLAAGQNNGQPFYFGGDKTNENWGGRLDDIAVWTKALPSTSISSLAAGTVTPLSAPTSSLAVPLITALNQGPTTHYFRKAFTFSGARDRTTLTLQHVLDDGAVFYLNGTEILRVNMPAGAVSHTTAASSDITSSTLSSSVTVPASALVVGNNVLAVEVHQSATNSDMVFGATLVASEAPAVLDSGSLFFSEISGATDAAPFIELVNRSAATVDLAGWQIRTDSGAIFTLNTASVAPGAYVSLSTASLGLTLTDGMRLLLFAPGGTSYRDGRAVTSRLRGLTSDGLWGHPTTPTPGAANIVSVSNAMVINEIFYKGLDNSPEQWVELYNRSAAPVDISNWKLSDGISYQFAPNTPPVPAGGYVVVAWDVAAFATLHGFSPYGPFSGSLSGSGELLTLRDAFDNVVNQLTYSSGGRWPADAHGGGSSLELRDPRADNSKGEAWDASDESSKSNWVTFNYSAPATNSTASDPTNYNEFVFGLLESGEFLMDDISVKDVTQGNIELIQNGTFSDGTASKWRIIGTHSGSVITDPTAGGNKVLKVVASSATEHMHNHAETTLKNGAAYHSIVSTDTYAISFRAKWLKGSNRLNARLWHNRLASQILLDRPKTGGTPGAANGKRVSNIGPTFNELAHTPVVPAAGQTAVVSIRVGDLDGVGAVQLFTSINGAAFSSTAMTTSAGSGIYTGTVPAQAAGALVQFYVQATDTLGAVSYFPAAGAGSRAMIPWADGRAQLTLASGAKPHNLRVVLPTADATELYKVENLMSDAAVPCTIILDESVAFYRAGVRLKSSEHGRITDTRCGYTLEFPDDDLFLGQHDTVGVDRSGGTAAGQKEILLRRLENTAGGIYAPEDDLCRVISAVGGAAGAFTGINITGAAILSKTRLDKSFLDGQFASGSDGGMQKYERIYVLTETINATTRVRTTPTFGVAGTVLSAIAEDPKVPQSTTSPPGVGFVSLGSNKEAYRWYWLIQNNRTADEYSGIMNVTNAVGQTGGSASFNTLVSQYVDVDKWLRACVPATLYGVQDNYLGKGGGQHNTLVYFPPGQKALLIPWDLDFLDQTAPTASLTAGGDVAKFILNPLWKRLFYGHIYDLLSRTFNTSYMTTWATHYSRFGTDDLVSQVNAYLTPRASYAASAITAAIPQVSFARTSASPVTVTTPFATVSGNGWVNVASIRLQGSPSPLAVTWTGESTWSVQLPVAAGTNTYVLVAYDSAGAQLATTSVSITATGTILAAGPGNLMVSELNYNPPGSGDSTEFLELFNATSSTLDLSGCHFDEEAGQGIAYTFPAGVQMSARSRLVIARDRAAFIAMYGAANLAPNEYNPSGLDNNGESLVLYAASGSEIFRFSYSDGKNSTDGNGRSLVRVISSTAPNPLDYTWRASIADGGNPGTSDALVFTGSPGADGDFDGSKALMEYVFGTSDSNAASRPPVPTILTNLDGTISVIYSTLPNADDAILSIETSTDLNGLWLPYSGSVPGGGPRFFRLRATTR